MLSLCNDSIHIMKQIILIQVPGIQALPQRPAILGMGACAYFHWAGPASQGMLDFSINLNPKPKLQTIFLHYWDALSCC